MTKELDEFYQIEPDPSDYFKDKLKNDKAFYKVWEQMRYSDEEKLRELFGTEFEHIDNHFIKVKNTK